MRLHPIHPLHPLHPFNFNLSHKNKTESVENNSDSQKTITKVIYTVFTLISSFIIGITFKNIFFISYSS